MAESKSFLNESIAYFANRYDVVFTIVGALIGGIVGYGYASQFFMYLPNAYITSAFIGGHGDSI
ncbi:MAG: hypothetical protein HN790_15035, partial [Methylococcales bacterium]|nr:hypothetical protein [Methylococcales bacterium]